MVDLNQHLNIIGQMSENIWIWLARWVKAFEYDRPEE